MNEDDLTELLREHAQRPFRAGGGSRDPPRGSSDDPYYGVADVTTGEPVTSETRFSVGSLTKSMVATVNSCSGGFRVSMSKRAIGRSGTEQ